MSRIRSLDLLRGIVMVIMTLDHVRDYFHYDAFLFKPDDLEHTNPALFLTRWITHFCAPVFVFLAGTSANLMGQNLKSKKELSIWLLTRGLWLVILELTFIKFGWTFQLNYNYTLLMVIWALGVSMIFLSALIHLNSYIILSIGILIVAGHNLLDNIKDISNPVVNALWSILHEHRRIKFDGFSISVGYPVLPWIGVMALGYCFGYWYKKDISSQLRRNNLIMIGALTILAFLILRTINVYGDPSPWQVQKSEGYTLLSILNTSKYPPSLLYLCMTLGPAILFLAYAEKFSGWLIESIVKIGRVPLFYYLVHIFVIHLVAVIAALWTGYDFSDMIIKKWINKQSALKGYGFALGYVYLIWIVIVVVILYPLSNFYYQYKNKHKENKWLKYI